MKFLVYNGQRVENLPGVPGQDATRGLRRPHGDPPQRRARGGLSQAKYGGLLWPHSHPINAFNGAPNVQFVYGRSADSTDGPNAFDAWHEPSAYLDPPAQWPASNNLPFS